MEFIFFIIVVVLKILIAIGDAVLLILKFLGKTVVKILLLFILACKNNLARLRKLLTRIKPLINRLSQPKIKIKIIAPTIKPSLKPIKKQKPVVIFPLPFSLKFRYFAAGFLFSLVVIFIPLLLFLFLQDLPNPNELSLRLIPQTTKIYDRNGILLYQIYATQNRTIVPLSNIPKPLQLATIAIEDKDFYKHPGFDVEAIIRSAFKNVSGDGLQGGSTITQQLIKSALLSPETSIVRKIKEAILAFWAERIYNKNQILELYFNQIPYGGTAWGVEAAAEVYFGKKVENLDLAESAFLAGIPKAPTTYSPFGTSPTLWKKRQSDVLKKMTELGYITKDQAGKATERELNFQTPQTPIYAPHFVMYVKDLLVKKYGLAFVERGGLTVVTSLDLKLQQEAQKIVKEEVDNNAYLHITNGSALITNPKNGDVLAMVGSKDFYDSNGGNVNVATSLRQPGSSIKIVTYAAALSQGLTAATILDDSPITYRYANSPSYSPVNYDGKFHGKIPLRLAFANSFNIPAVKTLNQIGIPDMVNLGKKMGITSWGEPSQYGLSITLGGAEVKMTDMAAIYGTVANNGVKIDLNPLIKVSDYKGNILEQKDGALGERVLDEGVTFILSSILSDNASRSWEFGINSPLNIPNHTVSVKTGTSDNKRDNWTVGYTTANETSQDSYVVAAWVGNNDNSPMSQQLASGITGAAPIWNKIMNLLLVNKADAKPKVPLSVISKPCLGRIEYFIKGTENSISCILPPTPTPTPNP